MAEESGIATWAVVFATILGPVLAVQAQKWIERVHDKKKRRVQIFEILLSTQSQRLHVEHIAALNMIIIAFSDKKDKEILNAWRDYLAHLRTDNSKNFDAWVAKSDELLRTLLWEIAKVVGFSGEKGDLKLSGYWPDQHFIRERAEILARNLLIDVLSGKTPLKVEAPNDDGNALRESLESAFEGGKLKISVEGDVFR